MSLNPETLRPGDLISHPSWQPNSYPVTSIGENRFYIDMGGTIPNGFPFYAEFYLVESKTREKKKSGFGRWIAKHD